MNRRLIITGIAVLFIIGGLLFWYFLPSAPKPPGAKSFLDNLPIIGGRAPAGGTPPTPPPGTNGTGESEAERAKRLLVQVVDKDILAPTLSADEKLLYYILRENGHVVSSDLNGDGEATLVNLTVLDAFDASWPVKKNRVAMRYYENGVTKTFLNGVATGTTSRFLPPETISYDWSPSGLSLAYLIRRANDTALVIADAANQNPRVVYTTPVPDFMIRWISTNTILLISRPSGLAPSLVMSFDIANRVANVLLTAARGVVVAPLANGSGFAFSQSTTDGKAGPLSFYAMKDGAITSLHIATIGEKCASSPDSKTLYCGVPRGVILSPSPDEWYKGITSFSDDLVQIDFATGETKILVANPPDFDVISPFVSSDGVYLFFQNKKDGTLWRFTLKEAQPSG